MSTETNTNTTEVAPAKPVEEVKVEVDYKAMYEAKVKECEQLKKDYNDFCKNIQRAGLQLNLLAVNSEKQ